LRTLFPDKNLFAIERNFKTLYMFVYSWRHRFLAKRLLTKHLLAKTKTLRYLGNNILAKAPFGENVIWRKSHLAKTHFGEKTV
jgi:hypothetical protein